MRIAKAALDQKADVPLRRAMIKTIKKRGKIGVVRSTHFGSHRIEPTNSIPNAEIEGAPLGVGILRRHRHDGAAADAPTQPSIWAPRAPFLAQLMSSAARQSFPLGTTIHCYEAANDLSEPRPDALVTTA